MGKKVALIVLFCICFASCFKRAHLNQNALLHQRACIESIELNDHLRAATHCELCLEYDAAMPECLNGIGLIALMNKDEEKARIFFTRALRQDNDFSQARNNLGVIHFSHGEFSEALKYFDRALEIDPSNADARYNAGLSHFRLGQKMRALDKSKESKNHLLTAKDQIQKLVAIEPTFPAAFRDLGLIDLNLYDLSDFDSQQKELLLTAKKSFNHCLEAHREEDGCYEGLGQVFFEEGRFDQSFANYFLCLTFAPNNAACRNGIVLAYEKNAHAEGAYKQFKTYVKEDQKNAFAHEAFCGALFERGFSEEGVKECEVALRLKPDLCSAQFRLGNHFAAVLNAERATKHCQAFLACGNKSKPQEIKRCQELLATLQR